MVVLLGICWVELAILRSGNMIYIYLKKFSSWILTFDTSLLTIIRKKMSITKKESEFKC